MQKYLNLLREIKEKGTHKNAARIGMPGTTSLFGYQFRHNLAEGFPLLTTKKMFWKGIVVELMWFLSGNTNIKYLLDHDVHIWDQDAYNYYCKHLKTIEQKLLWKIPFDEFIKQVQETSKSHLTPIISNYKFGDCGYQYGKIWRHWENTQFIPHEVDQISNLIEGLKSNPESRRHILTSIDPVHQDDLALYWCHALSQFNCRPLTNEQRNKYSKRSDYLSPEVLDSLNIPKYYLDCQMYQRSADVILGVPFNIASYALLTHIFCKICNMIPGEMIYTYGDVHIYDNHMEAVNEQLQREPRSLPILNISNIQGWNRNLDDILTTINNVSNYSESIFSIENYDPYPKLKNEAKLNTGV